MSMEIGATSLWVQIVVDSVFLSLPMTQLTTLEFWRLQMSLSSLEQQIIEEYGIITGWIKNHNYLAIIFAFTAGYVLRAIQGWF